MTDPTSPTIAALGGVEPVHGVGIDPGAPAPDKTPETGKDDA